MAKIVRIDGTDFLYQSCQETIRKYFSTDIKRNMAGEITSLPNSFMQAELKFVFLLTSADALDCLSAFLKENVTIIYDWKFERATSGAVTGTNKVKMGMIATEYAVEDTETDTTTVDKKIQTLKRLSITFISRDVNWTKPDGTNFAIRVMNGSTVVQSYSGKFMQEITLPTTSGYYYTKHRGYRTNSGQTGLQEDFIYLQLGAKWRITEDTDLARMSGTVPV